MAGRGPAPRLRCRPHRIPGERFRLARVRRYSGHFCRRRPGSRAPYPRPLGRVRPRNSGPHPPSPAPQCGDHASRVFMARAVAPAAPVSDRSARRNWPARRQDPAHSGTARGVTLFAVRDVARRAGTGTVPDRALRASGDALGNGLARPRQSCGGPRLERDPGPGAETGCATGVAAGSGGRRTARGRGCTGADRGRSNRSGVPS